VAQYTQTQLLKRPQLTVQSKVLAYQLWCRTAVSMLKQYLLAMLTLTLTLTLSLIRT